jgi:hypothetical protein
MQSPECNIGADSNNSDLKITTKKAKTVELPALKRDCSFVALMMEIRRQMHHTTSLIMNRHWSEC